MYPHQAMMEADSKFIGRIGSMFEPITDIIHERPHFLVNPIVVDANVAIALAVLAGPIPDVSIHPLVNLADETLIDEIERGKTSHACEQPLLCLQNVLLFLAIQFGAIGDVRRFETSAFLKAQLGLIVVRIKEIGHLRLSPQLAEVDLGFDVALQKLLAHHALQRLVLQQHGVLDRFKLFGGNLPGLVLHDLFQ